MKLRSLVFIFVFLCTNYSKSQNLSKKNEATPFVLGVVDSIYSKELSEFRTLNIYLPEGYADTTASYPVIYLLDGSANEDFIHIVGIVQFLTMIVDTIPKCIVVGIANVDRRRDFTFPTTIEQDRKDFPTTGGSAKFILFIQKELQPYIEKNYRASPSKTIIGQSLGGLLATEILFKDPDLFTNYMIVSPSLWWNNESLLSNSPEALKKAVDQPISVYISAGMEGKQMEDDAKKLADILQQSGRKNLKVYFNPMPEENHLTILHNSIYRGLEIIYSKK